MRRLATRRPVQHKIIYRAFVRIVEALFTTIEAFLVMCGALSDMSGYLLGSFKTSRALSRQVGLFSYSFQTNTALFRQVGLFLDK